ncbi:MAG TPA: DNA polymerase/3'-5' exonuclease PolX [Opitutales bacterium]|jgi:DNA polymerase (family 10)|nr:DNA polymerase/3'-5' exonuclease PolX [Opitutales bacterium]
MNKSQIVEVLEEIGTLLELSGENPFKVRAYQNGARALGALEDDLGERIAAGTLGEVPGLGEALVEKITTLYQIGELPYYDKLKASVKPGLVEMLGVPGLGPKKIMTLHAKLGVDSLAKLAEACAEGKVAALAGFGAKTQENIMAGIKNKEAYGRRHLWWDAWQVAAPIVEGLGKIKGVERVSHAGSLRRGLETIGDLDFLVAAANPEPAMKWFTTQPNVAEITASGGTKASVRLQDGTQADLRVVPLKQFYFALHHFTGSKDHNVKMRSRALTQGLSLSEWGLSKKDDPTTGGPEAQSVITPKSEDDIFKKLGLHPIPPELREGLDEIERAERGPLPKLVEDGDLRGAFHNHTTSSDGHASLEEMAAAAEKLGWEYLGIADHSKSSFQAHGLNEEQLLAQVEKIRGLNDSKKFRVHIFAGTECDILKDGELDYDDGVLAQLDYVVASAHNRYGQGADEAAMTKRIIRALEHPRVTMLGHATGRLLLQREGYALNIGKVIDAAAANKKMIELNAQPQRLDLDWRYWRQATDKGVLCVINPDAHSTTDLEFVRMGVLIARKGWLTKEQIFNTRPLAEILTALKIKRPQRSARG